MWIVYVIICIALWGITDVLYKKGVRKEEKYIPLKFSIVIGLICFLIALVYLITRDEPFTIWESAVRFWPVTIFGIVYAIVNTISFNGFLYNDASVIAPIENTANGSYVMILVIVYALLGKVSSIWEVITVYKFASSWGSYLLELCSIMKRKSLVIQKHLKPVQQHLFFQSFFP